MSYAPASYSSHDAPLSAREISDRALDYEYDTDVPLKYWLRTTGTLQREAEIYLREGNDEQAYLLLLRHANLLIERLPTHPSAREPENRKHLSVLQKSLPATLKTLEELKPRINNRHKVYLAQQEIRRHRKSQSAKEAEYYAQQQHQQKLDQDYLTYNPSQRPASLSSSRQTASSSTSSRDYNGLDGDHGQARPKMRSDGSERSTRRHSGLPSTLTPGPSLSSRSSYSAAQHFEEHGWAYEPESVQPPASSLSEKRLSRNAAGPVEYDLQNSIRALHLHSENPLPPALQMGLQESARRPSLATARQPSYPGVPKRGPAMEDYDAYHTDRGNARTRPTRAPTLPPKVRSNTYDAYEDSYVSPRPPPSRPEKTLISPPSTPTVPDVPAVTTTSNYQFESVAYTEGGQALRTIFLPEGIRTKFLQVAAPNTRRNLETCGILCGFLKQNGLFINRLVIPDQEATSDTCGTTDEEGLFNYVDGEDLMVLGWIHTHPTQSCFMSSVDLHTHCAYQMMMAESIAIVCAPQHDPSWGIFRLTDPSGVKAISTCKQRATFHPHSQNDIYTDALRPGHVCEVKEMGFGVIDLRPAHHR